MTFRAESERNPSGVTPLPTDRPTDRPREYVGENLLLRDMRGRPVDNPCRWCNGSGWEDGPDEYETVNGQPHRYTTVIPCRHTRPTTREWTGGDASSSR